MRSRGSNEILAWENIELISDRPTDIMLNELKSLKEQYPDRIVIASIMEEYDRSAWEQLIGLCQEAGKVNMAIMRI